MGFAGHSQMHCVYSQSLYSEGNIKHSQNSHCNDFPEIEWKAQPGLCGSEGFGVTMMMGAVEPGEVLLFHHKSDDDAKTPTPQKQMFVSDSDSDNADELLQSARI